VIEPATPLRSILIVEDERIVAADLQAMLIDMGYDAYAIASSGAEAIAHATARAPDLALMDINIKGPMDGVETAALLRERSGTAIVFLTAFAYDSTAERVEDSEPYAYLVKPVTSPALKSTIELSLHRHDLERRLHHREQELSRNNVQLSTLIDHIQSGVLVEDEHRRMRARIPVNSWAPTAPHSRSGSKVASRNPSSSSLESTGSCRSASG
jgi:CheY-like chemotaxis protein